MTLFPLSTQSQAYVDGYKNGRTDRQLGIKSEYAFNGIHDSNDYIRNYALGYRQGLLGLKF